MEHIWPRGLRDSWENEMGESGDRSGGSHGCGMDDFGNLALISHHMNITFRDQEFGDKGRDLCKQLDRGTLESLKMILVYLRYKDWNPKHCEEHHKEMLDLLQSYLEKPDKWFQVSQTRSG